MSDLPTQERMREIRRRLRLEPLTREQVEKGWFVDTHEARSESCNVRDAMREELIAAHGENRPVSLLFYGHGGSGKSTELVTLSREKAITDRFMVVQFSVKEHLDLVSFDAHDLLLVMAEQALLQANAEGLDLPDDALTGVHAFFSEITQTHSQTRDTALGIGAGAEVSTPGMLSGLLSLFARFSADIKLGVTDGRSVVQVVKQRPAELLAQVNDVFSAIIRAGRSLPGQPRDLLVIVEDLDKVDIGPARRLFLDQTKRLNQLRCAVIYTVPIHTAYSPEWSSVRRSFTRSFQLPMIKVCEPGGRACAVGRAVLRDIVDRRLRDLDAAGTPCFAPDALELAIEMTGGVIQHLFEVLYTATNIRGAGLPVDKQAVRKALDMRAADLWAEITLPSLEAERPTGVEKLEDLYDRLELIAQKEAGSETPAPADNDTANQLLLRCHALIEYNGLRWLGVHPLVKETLARRSRTPA